MKNIRNVFILATAFLSLFISCKKNPSTNEPALTGCRISSLKMAEAETKMNYDPQGNLKLITEYQNNTKMGYTEFTYTTSQIVENLYDNTGGLSGTATYTLGSNGFPKYVVSDGYGTTDSTYYTYNSNGYLIKLDKRNYLKTNNVFQLNYSLTEDYTITDGNRTHQKETVRGAYHYDRDVDYEYYMDQPYYTGINGDYPFLGKTNASLLKKMSYTESNYPTVVSHQYQFDADHKPIKLTSTLSGSTDITNISLDYTCN